MKQAKLVNHRRSSQALSMSFLKWASVVLLFICFIIFLYISSSYLERLNPDLLNLSHHDTTTKSAEKLSKPKRIFIGNRKINYYHEFTNLFYIFEQLSQVMLTPRTAELFKGRVGHQKSNFSLLIQRNGQFVTLFAHWKVKASMRFAPNQQSTKTSNYYRLQIVLSILMQRWSGWYWIG